MNTEHWLMAQELRWRSAACAVWIWLLMFPVTAGFLFTWLLLPYNIFILYDFFVLLFAFRSWFLAFCIACLCVLYVKINKDTYSVNNGMKSTRIDMLLKHVRPKSIVYTLSHAFLGNCITFLISNFVPTRFTHISTLCNSLPESNSCFNESCFIFHLFGFVVGSVSFILREENRESTLFFPPVQQGRFLSVKCHLTNLMLKSASVCAKILAYFLLVYYLVGFLGRNFLATLLGFPLCAGHIISLWNLFDLVPLAWSLWLSGTFVLLLQNLTWHLFNVYLTQIFQFPMDSVFPEDVPKLLTTNLNNSQPAVVQHMAFQYLSFISQFSASKRKQIFMLGSESGSGKLFKWDVIADECISRISTLTEKLKDYQQGISFTGDAKRSSSKSSSTSSQSSASLNSGSQSVLSVSMLRRRPLASDSSRNPNMSYFEVSSLDTSYAPPSQLNTSALLNGSLAVPTPKLWTKQARKNQANVSTSVYGSSTTQDQDDEASYETFKGQLKKLGARLLQSVRGISVVSYFITELPDRKAGNIFADHQIYRWSIQSISFLTAASITEDDYGFVQRRLHEVLGALLDLLSVLEKNCKLSVTSSSPAVLSLLRQQHSLKAETKSAIHRITNSFARHLDSIAVSAEHRRRLTSFLEQRE
ncbi:unnamed protein product [Clavelina lepadiformis]|uniref:Nucleoporin NDC1 n=1 Tax=Clavelina lepadiformis TaxID=159417 RepID=A0ABP0FSA5_CLALP